MYKYHEIIYTSKREEILDIKDIVKRYVRSSGVKDGICVLFLPHTTCAISLNEDADPSVKRDVIDTLSRLVPRNLVYDHAEGNSDAHIKTTVIGSSLTLIISDGDILLGTWQGIYLCEFDGPRKRTLIISILQG